MAISPVQPVRFILDNEYLPAAVHEAANEWRALDERELDAEEQLHALRSDATAAKAADRDAAVKAVAAGKPVPVPMDANVRANTEAADAKDTELGLIRTAKARAGRSLLNVLLANRDELLQMTLPTVRTAAADYLALLDRTEKELRAGLARLTAATSPLGTLDDLDSAPRDRSEIAAASVHITGADLKGTRKDVQALLTRVDLTVEPADRLIVRSTSGDYLSMPTGQALAGVRDVGMVVVAESEVPAGAHVVPIGA
jgi:hypothetical protein